MAERETFPGRPELDFIVQWLGGKHRDDRKANPAKPIVVCGRLMSAPTTTTIVCGRLMSAPPALIPSGSHETVLCFDNLPVARVIDGCVVAELVSGRRRPTLIRIINAIARELGVPEIEQQSHDVRFIGGNGIFVEKAFEVAGPLTLLAYRATYRARALTATSATVGETP